MYGLPRQASTNDEFLRKLLFLRVEQSLVMIIQLYDQTFLLVTIVGCHNSVKAPKISWKTELMYEFSAETTSYLAS